MLIAPVKGFDNKHRHGLCGDNFTQSSENQLFVIDLVSRAALPSFIYIFFSLFLIIRQYRLKTQKGHYTPHCLAYNRALVLRKEKKSFLLDIINRSEEQYFLFKRF